jgi:hypothetical protein
MKTRAPSWRWQLWRLLWLLGDLVAVVPGPGRLLVAHLAAAAACLLDLEEG